MWAWLKSPRGSTLTATAVVAVLALYWLAPWSRPLPHVPGLPAVSEPVKAPQADATPPAPKTPAPVSTASQQTPAAASAASASTTMARAEPATSAPATTEPPAGAAPTPAPSATAPSFDVVRVEPSGATVVAGRGEPGSVVTLFDGGQPLAHATIDAGGQFALLPPDLTEGSHYLTLQAGAGGTTVVVSKQGVAINVPKAGGANRPMVAMLAPDQPVRVLSDGSPIAATGLAGSLSPAQAMTIQAVEAARGGKFTASGVAKAGSQSRVYLNGAFLADVTADKDGRWAVRIEKGMRPGQYVVRADELEGAGGKVVHRAEVPFTYPATLGRGTGKQLLMAHTQPLPGAAPAGQQAMAGTVGVHPAILSATTKPRQSVAALGTVPAPSDDKPATAAPVASVVADLRLTTVSRGDSLWRISRKLLGRGIDYTEIFASNTNQIRDPARIYPGQIFVLPQRPAK